MFFNKLTLSCKLLKDFHNKGVITLSEYMQGRKKKTKSFNSQLHKVSIKVAKPN